MDVRQLRYLIAVVEEHSISRAAVRLLMTQPPLSMAITQLEKELGVPLLDRHAKGVRTTAAGEYLVVNARRLLAEIDELSDLVKAIGEGSRGRLSLAVVPSSAWELVPTMLRAFNEQCPDADVELLEAPPGDVIDAVRSRRVDAGLVYSADTDYLMRANVGDLEVDKVRDDPLVLVMTPHHPATAPVVDLADVAGDRWVLPLTREGYPGLAELVQESWQAAGIAPPRARNVDTLQTALPLVQAGLAVTVMPESITKVAGDRVATARLRQGIRPLEAAMIWRRTEQPPPVLAEFLAIARAVRAEQTET